jgi:hypothetical protein
MIGEKNKSKRKKPKKSSVGSSFSIVPAPRKSGGSRPVTDRVTKNTPGLSQRIARAKRNPLKYRSSSVQTTRNVPGAFEDGLDPLEKKQNELLARFLNDSASVSYR